MPRNQHGPKKNIYLFFICNNFVYFIFLHIISLFEGWKQLRKEQSHVGVPGKVGVYLLYAWKGKVTRDYEEKK